MGCVANMECKGSLVVSMCTIACAFIYPLYLFARYVDVPGHGAAPWHFLALAEMLHGLLCGDVFSLQRPARHEETICPHLVGQMQKLVMLETHVFRPVCSFEGFEILRHNLIHF